MPIYSTGGLRNRDFELDCQEPKAHIAKTTADQKSLKLWHRRFAHCDPEAS